MPEGVCPDDLEDVPVIEAKHGIVAEQIDMLESLVPGGDDLKRLLFDTGIVTGSGRELFPLGIIHDFHSPIDDLISLAFETQGAEGQFKG